MAQNSNINKANDKLGVNRKSLGEQMRAPNRHLTFVRYKYDLERCRGELKGYEISLAKRHIDNAIEPQPLYHAWITTLTEAVKNYKARIAELEKIDEEKQAGQDR